MAESAQEAGVIVKELPGETEFNLDQWRVIFHLAALSWNSKQDRKFAARKVKTGQLNRMAHDKNITPEEQDKASDVAFARGVMVVTQAPNDELFPKSESVSIDDALGDAGTMFMYENIPHDQMNPVFEEIVLKRNLKRRVLEDEMPLRFPRPEFLTAAVQKWERGEI